MKHEMKKKWIKIKKLLKKKQKKNGIVEEINTNTQTHDNEDVAPHVRNTTHHIVAISEFYIKTIHIQYVYPYVCRVVVVVVAHMRVVV